MTAWFDGTTLPKVTVWAGVGTPEAGSICVRGTGTRGTHVRGVTAGTALVALPTADVQSITITRGRDSDTESAAPGTCTVTFDNTSGDYDHTYTAGPWFGRLNLGVTLEVRMEWAGHVYRRFTGQIADLSIDAGMTPTATWTAIDGLEKLGRTYLPLETVAFDGQRSGERIATLADRAGWPTTLRAIDTGYASVNQTGFGDFTLELMRKVELSEFGFLFVDGGGQLVFYDRYRSSTASRSVTIQATFTDTAAAGVVEMETLELSRSRERVFNRAALTREVRPQDPTAVEEEPPADTPAEQVTDNLAAQVEPFGVLAFPGNAGEVLATDPAVKSLTELIVARYGTATDRIREVTVNAVTQGMWATLLPLTLLDRISVTRDYGPNTITAELLIQGLTETITDTPSWDLVYSTAEPAAALASPCVRGDGVRDTDNRVL